MKTIGYIPKKTAGSQGDRGKPNGGESGGGKSGKDDEPNGGENGGKKPEEPNGGEK